MIVTSTKNEIHSDQLESESQSQNRTNTHTLSLVQTNTSSLFAPSLQQSISTKLVTTDGIVEKLKEAVHKMIDELTESD